MSEVFRCDDKETLVAYLYGEVEEDVRREVERHLRTCAACARETDGLQSVRQDLQSWLPPEPDLNFTIVQRASQPAQPATVLTASRWSSIREMPAWARVAAAALFMGIGAGLANVHVRSSSEGFVVTTGWMQPAPVSLVPVAAKSTDGDWRRELAALEQTLRGEMAAQHASDLALVSTRTPAPSLETTNSAVLRRMRALIADSEERQRQETAIKLVQAQRIWELRRQTDLMSFQRSLGSLQNRTLAVQANQQDMIKRVGQLQRVSFPPPNQ